MSRWNQALDKRRMVFMLLIFTCCLAIWIIRLFWLQLFAGSSLVNGGHPALLERAVSQRMMSIVTDLGRGDIYDRHMEPMTGSLIHALVLFPLNRQEESVEDKEKWRELARILRVAEESLLKFREDLREPRWWMDEEDRLPQSIAIDEEQQIERLGLAGVEVVELKLRYLEEPIARQLIGFIGEHPERLKQLYSKQLATGQLSLSTQIGASGLELTFDSILRGLGTSQYSVFTDGEGRYLRGLGARLTGLNPNPFHPLKLVTTLDQTLQRKIEKLLDQRQIQMGSVVILDTHNADIVAMASRPQFDPYQREAINPAWNNRAIKAIVPGSIFKIVVAAAALETKVTTKDEVFECDGELGKYGFTCWKKSGHGQLTINEAFAQSCNIVFARLSERITADQLRDTAESMGLLQPVGWTGSIPGQTPLRQLDAEESGQLFDPLTPMHDQGVMVQTSIGQRDVRMSALQAANMIVSIINQGEVKSPRIVKEIRFQNNALMHAFHEHKQVSKRNGITNRTANQLMKWMEETVSSGTAQSLKSASWKLAGKTGTAQLSAENKEWVNQWFVGYGPTESPRYAIAVVLERIPYQLPAVLPFVHDLIDILAEHL